MAKLSMPRSVLAKLILGLIYFLCAVKIFLVRHRYGAFLSRVR